MLAPNTQYFQSIIRLTFFNSHRAGSSTKFALFGSDSLYSVHDERSHDIKRGSHQNQSSNYYGRVRFRNEIQRSSIVNGRQTSRWNDKISFNFSKSNQKLIQVFRMQNLLIISSFLSSCHEKAMEALYTGRIQTRLEVVFASEFSAWLSVL